MRVIVATAVLSALWALTALDVLFGWTHRDLKTLAFLASLTTAVAFAVNARILWLRREEQKYDIARPESMD